MYEDDGQMYFVIERGEGTRYTGSSARGKELAELNCDYEIRWVLSRNGDEDTWYGYVGQDDDPAWLVECDGTELWELVVVHDESRLYCDYGPTGPREALQELVSNTFPIVFTQHTKITDDTYVGDGMYGTVAWMVQPAREFMQGRA